MLNGPCPQHATAEGPATHSWEDCYVMQEFRAEALKRSQGGEQGQRQEQPGASGSRQVMFGGFPKQGPQGGSQHNAGQYQVQNQQYHPPGIFQQHPPQGDPQRQEGRGGFQNNPKQLNSGQYHVFTTNTCKRDHKVKHRTSSMSWRSFDTFTGQSNP